LQRATVLPHLITGAHIFEEFLRLCAQGSEARRHLKRPLMDMLNPLLRAYEETARPLGGSML
jgi:hypothetical protein